MDSAETPGEAIRRAREKSGMSVEEVAQAIRVRPVILLALESDDVEAVGGPAYVRGHLRSIAALLGLDPQQLVSDVPRLDLPGVPRH